jgi:hypothetical protein
MNSVVRAVLVDVATQRQRPDDPHELVFPWARTGNPTKFFSATVERARRVPEAEGKATGTWTRTRGMGTGTLSPPGLSWLR